MSEREPRTIANYATVALIGDLNAIREEIGDSRKTTELIRLARLAADLLAARDAEIERLWALAVINGAEAERLRADSRRYQWLREGTILNRFALGNQIASFEEMDAFIDAAIAQPKEPT